MKIQSLTINYFKNINRETPLTWDFTKENTVNAVSISPKSDKQVFIVGDNGVGKTTIFDAISMLFTNKLFSGSVQGWQPLTTDNQLCDVKPYIEITFTHNNTTTTLKLQNGHRYINDIKISNYTEFKNFLLSQFQLNCDSFLNEVNAAYMFDNLSIKELRSLVFVKLLNDGVFKEVDATFKNDDFIKSFDQLFVDEILNSIKMFGYENLIKQYNADIKSNTEKLKLLSTSLSQVENVIWTQNEEQVLETHTQTYNSLAVKLNELSTEISNINIQSLKEYVCEKCGYQSTTSPQVTRYHELQEMKKQLSQEQFEVRSKMELLKSQKQKFENLQKQNANEINDLNVLISKINEKKLLVEKHQEITLLHVDSYVKSKLNIDLKLFHQTKDGSLNETFTVLENGVDYKYLNKAAQIKIGLKLINFLFDQNENRWAMLFIDEMNSLDQTTLDEISSKTEYVIFAGVHN